MAKLETLRAGIEAAIDACNAAIKNNNLEAMNDAEEELKKAEERYAEAKMTEVFKTLEVEEDPIRAAIATLNFDVIGHVMERFKGVLIGVSINPAKVVPIDLVKFCKHCGLDTDWQHAVNKFNQLCCLRAATDLGCSKSELQRICDTFYLQKTAERIADGGTPTGDTALKSALQGVLDLILFEDDGKGKNKYCVRDKDVRYVLHAFSKKSKNALRLQVAKNTAMTHLVTEVFHAIYCMKEYGVEYKEVKPEEAEKIIAGRRAAEQRAKEAKEKSK